MDRVAARTDARQGDAIASDLVGLDGSDQLARTMPRWLGLSRDAPFAPLVGTPPIAEAASAL